MVIAGLPHVQSTKATKQPSTFCQHAISPPWLQIPRATKAKGLWISHACAGVVCHARSVGGRADRLDENRRLSCLQPVCDPMARLPTQRPRTRPVQRHQLLLHGADGYPPTKIITRRRILRIRLRASSAFVLETCKLLEATRRQLTHRRRMLASSLFKERRPHSPDFSRTQNDQEHLLATVYSGTTTTTPTIRRAGPKEGLDLES